jgi:predicted ferric reductase
MTRQGAKPLVRTALWLVVAAVALVPLGVAAASPLQASRDALWVAGGMAGVVALALLFVQPLLISGVLPWMQGLAQRRWHRWIGTAITGLVVLHVGGLYLTSPEDITDALLLVSPTPFAVYGVIGFWAVILTACLAAFRRRLRPRLWQAVHSVLAAAIVVGSVVHAVLIEGVMGDMSKLVLSVFSVAAAGAVLLKVALGRRLAAGR